MRNEDGVYVFDNLVRPDEEIVGTTRPVRVKVPSFSASNAKGDLRPVENFDEVTKIANECGSHFRKIFQP